jgi:hypothetical protein
VDGRPPAEAENSITVSMRGVRTNGVAAAVEA